MTFDPQAFMNSASDPMPTQYPVCPEGEYLFVIDSDPKACTVENVSGISQKTGKPYDFNQMVLACLCQDDGVRQKLGQERVTVRLRINLDLDPSTNKLVAGEGKNVALGRLREALGQNKPGWTPQNLLGAGPFMGLVKHTTTEKGTFADIARVSKVS